MSSASCRDAGYTFTGGCEDGSLLRRNALITQSAGQ
jgi:hypothetical protein